MTRRLTESIDEDRGVSEHFETFYFSTRRSHQKVVTRNECSLHDCADKSLSVPLVLCLVIVTDKQCDNCSRSAGCLLPAGYVIWDTPPSFASLSGCRDKNWQCLKRSCRTQ
ncbi:hypothetical protein BaRGS_00023798 [Batillaria attramentaria]|uniref:Uncharacterized protein n=1 Tax=Batillaria attramentaria TaxID=370345 RepID=A0ABD0KD25_9CAEN